MERNILIRIVLVGAFITGIAKGTIVRWSLDEGGNGHFYEAVVAPTGIFWSQAKAAAEAKGGYLATITSAEENEFVYGLITDWQYWNLDRWGPWLGGFQPEGSPEPNGNWQWVTGEPFVYTNWTSGQPDNFDSNESCLHFGAVPALKVSTWNDLPDAYTYAPIKGYIVEYDPSHPVRWPVSDGGNGHRYQAVAIPEGITWHEAKQAAEIAGGYLATITSDEENNFVFGLITVDLFWYFTGQSFVGPWLGGFQIPSSAEPDGGWQWITAEGFTYANWEISQPNNNYGTEDFLHYWYMPSRSPTWNDLSNDYSIVPGFVIEYPPCNPPITGDLNDDCIVNLTDLAIMASNWLQSTLR
jgi:hypothetical protein